MSENRMRSVPMATLLMLVVSFLLAGCYTMMKHPQIKPEASYVGEDVQRARRCTDCHAEMQVDPYYHDPFYRYDPFWVRRPFYAPSYYDRWRYYRSYPWWWDRYSYYDRTYWDDPYYPKTRNDVPREEKKRDWRRRTGFGGGGGVGGTFYPEPQVRSKASLGQKSSEVKKTTTEESTEREVPKVQKKTETSSQPKARASTSKSKESKKQEEKEQEKKKEGRSRRRKGMK